MEKNYKINIAITDDDILRIERCAQITWHSAYDNLLTQDQIVYMLNKFQSFASINDAIKNKEYQYYFISDTERAIAFCAVKPEETKLFISKIYVLPEYQRQGIATLLFRRVIKDYQDKFSTYYLTVNKNNTQAISTYRALGFSITDSITTDIGNGYIMDDYIMEYNKNNNQIF